jgi:hypothetical protein
MTSMLAWIALAWAVGFGFGLMIRTMWGFACPNADDNGICVPGRCLRDSEKRAEAVGQAWWREFSARRTTQASEGAK